MNIKPIKTDVDHEEALREIERLWGAKVGTPEGDKLDILMTLVDAYEEKRWPIDKPTPIEAIRFRMDQLGLKQKDLEVFIGSKSKVSEVLNGRRNLSLRMIRNLESGLNIPASILIQTQAN